MRAVIIDDEASLRESTRTLLAIYCPDIEIVGEAASVKSGIDLIKKTSPDLAFLDVELPDGIGFDIVHACREIDFGVIFITGHDAYAVKAFKLSAIDYILKPIDPEELERAVNKAKATLDAGLSGLSIKALASNMNQSDPIKKILLKDSDKVYLVSTEEIISCESDDNYTRFHLTENRTILVSTTLKEYDNMLSSGDFFRCHQSHLINLNFFSHLDKREGGSVHMKNGSVLPVSTRRKDSLLKALEAL